MEITYQCQAQIQKIIAGIKQIPTDFCVSEKYLCGLDNDTFIKTFVEFRSLLTNAYEDMLAHPEQCGLLLVAMNVSEYKNSRPRDSRASAKRLIAFLHLLGRTGELHGDILHITQAAFSEMMKVKYMSLPWNKNVPMLAMKLTEFGFVFGGLKGKTFDKNADEYTLSFPGNPAMIRVLKGYAMSIPVTDHLPKELISLIHYTLPDAVEDAQISVKFDVPLKAKEQELLDELMNTVQRDYIDDCRRLIEYAVSLGYLPHKTQVSGFAVSFTSKNTGRTMMKLTPRTGLNHMKFIPELKMKFPATKVYSDIFAVAVREEMESNGGLYTGCFGCGKCAGRDDSYVYTYPDGRSDFVCSNALMCPDWSRENLPEIMEMMKTQDEFWQSQK